MRDARLKQRQQVEQPYYRLTQWLRPLLSYLIVNLESCIGGDRLNLTRHPQFEVALASKALSPFLPWVPLDAREL